MKNNIIFYILIGVISLGVGFYVGIWYQKNQQLSRFSQPWIVSQTGRQGQNQGRFTGGMRPVSGEIIKKDQDSITIKTQNSSTKIILIPSGVLITKSQKATFDDLKEKETVFVIGQQNPDGSITAENIQIGQINLRRNNTN
ncbi:MAG: hypothetical protein QHH09_01170 [Microgenomates group bacterium]|nr:hypothetical protein [Microgenomates group bacterium]